MIKRVCPVCNSEWYSANSVSDWVCAACGETLTKEQNQQPDRGATK